MDASNIAAAITKLSPTSLTDAIARVQAIGFTAITFSGNPTDHTPDSS